MPKSTPSLFAVIPAAVRYDQDIPANAKVLFSEISALCNTFGVCWASDEYLKELYGFHERTIANLIKALADKQYITVEETQTIGEHKCRKISIPDGALAVMYSPAMMNLLEKQEKIFPVLENIFQNQENIFRPYIKNNNNILPPKAPQGGQASDVPKKKRREEYREQAEHEPERFDQFWQYYGRICPASKTPGSRQAAIRAWDKLQPDSDTIAAMGRALMQQQRGEDWKRGIGVPHASTWLNQHRWEDPAAGGGLIQEEAEAEQEGSRWL